MSEAKIGTFSRNGLYQITHREWDHNGTMFVTVREMVGQRSVDARTIRAMRDLARRALSHPNETRSARLGRILVLQWHTRHIRRLTIEPTMNDYTPRRCSKRWLDDDCPREVLVIIDHPNYPADRFTVIYADTMTDGRDTWLTYLALSESGSWYHGELKAHEVAAYRYREKHHYAKWSSLPAVVRAAVRRDLAESERES